MAPIPGRDAVYSAAADWKRRCLVADLSVFSPEPLWTAAHVDELITHFVDKPDLSNRSFEDKLRDQLAPASPQARQLAAEMLWVMYLFAYRMSHALKVARVRAVWAWSGSELPADHPLLREPLEQGIGHVGTAFNTGLWRELAFLIMLTKRMKALPPGEREALLADPWRFSEWLAEVPEGDRRQMRHILLHLLFPDSFERNASRAARDQIDRFYASLVEPGAVSSSRDRLTAQDQRILAVRKVLESRSDGARVDFYEEPYYSQWNPPVSVLPGKTGDEVEDDDTEYPPAGAGRAVGEPRVRAWVIGAAEGASRWPLFYDQGIIAIGWDEIGDLSQYRTREDVHAAIKRAYERDQDPTNDSLACYEFYRQMREGDEVFVKQGRDRVLGYGRISGPYQHDTSVPDYRNVRRVDWVSRGNWTLPDSARIPTKTLTEVTDYPAFLSYIRPLVRRTDPVPEPFTVDDALRDVFLAREEFERLLASLRRRKNLILQGSPGVGKSFLARRLAYALIGAKAPDQVQMVQFHQSYAYEDFIQGWRPAGDGGFERRNGVFYEFCRRAQARLDQPHVFVIDEINRGNLSKVFGELMLLIESDKRGPEFAIPLTYSESVTDTFYVPENVYVLGLMNTADRSLAMVDYALRRRFAFATLEPGFGSPAFRAALMGQGVDPATIDRIINRVGQVNRRIIEDHKNLGPGFAIGHSYFCPTRPVPDPAAWYEAVVREELHPLLEEYWFDDAKSVEQCMRVLGA
jgi:hypothetical protein